MRFLPLALGVALFVLARWFALAQTPRRASSFETLEWDLGTTPAGPMRAVVLLPRHRSPTDRFPLLIAFHGSGESLRGAERGAWGWARDYELGASDLALRRSHLSRDAFLDLVDEPRLAALRGDLHRQPYRGLVVVTPYTPNVLTSDGGPSLQQAFDDVVVNTIVARARRELPVLATREATGIDGVSLGGLHSLWIGLGHPDVFGAVGSLQAAVRNRQEQVADRYVASPTRPSQRIRLVTSDGDPLRPDNELLSETFRARGIVHEMRVVRGPHDYVFNRGPGGIEMLLFHDRALRGETPP